MAIFNLVIGTRGRMFLRTIRTLLTTTLLASPSFCFGQGEYSFYRHDTDTWYIVDTTNYSFTTWRSYASTLYGGKLASINSDSEEKWIQYNVRDSDGSLLEDEVWIGLHDSSSEGTYLWVDGETYSYSNWASDEPNDGGINGPTEDYIIYRFFSSGVWNDYTNTPSFGALIKCPSSAPSGSVCDTLNSSTDPACILGDIVLENGDIQSSQTFKHEGSIIAGNGVDPHSSPNGDLEVTGGTTVMWSEDYVAFRDGFSVNSGGALEVRVNSAQCS